MDALKLVGTISAVAQDGRNLTENILADPEPIVTATPAEEGEHSLRPQNYVRRILGRLGSAVSGGPTVEDLHRESDVPVLTPQEFSLVAATLERQAERNAETSQSVRFFVSIGHIELISYETAPAQVFLEFVFGGNSRRFCVKHRSIHALGKERHREMIIGEDGHQFITKPITCPAQTSTFLEDVYWEFEWRGPVTSLASESLTVRLWKQVGVLAYEVVDSAVTSLESIASEQMTQHFTIGAAPSAETVDTVSGGFQIYCEIVMRELFDFEVAVGTTKIDFPYPVSATKWRLTLSMENLTSGLFPFKGGSFRPLDGNTIEMQPDNLTCLEFPPIGSIFWRGTETDFSEQHLLLVLYSSTSARGNWQPYATLQVPVERLLGDPSLTISDAQMTLTEGAREPGRHPPFIKSDMAIVALPHYRQAERARSRARDAQCDLTVKVKSIVGLPPAADDAADWIVQFSLAQPGAEQDEFANTVTTELRRSAVIPLSQLPKNLFAILGRSSERLRTGKRGKSKRWLTLFHRATADMPDDREDELFLLDDKLDAQTSEISDSDLKTLSSELQKRVLFIDLWQLLDSTPDVTPGAFKEILPRRHIGWTCVSLLKIFKDLIAVRGKMYPDLAQGDASLPLGDNSIVGNLVVNLMALGSLTERTSVSLSLETQVNPLPLVMQFTAEATEPMQAPARPPAASLPPWVVRDHRERLVLLPNLLKLQAVSEAISKSYESAMNDIQTIPTSKFLQAPAMTAGYHGRGSDGDQCLLQCALELKLGHDAYVGFGTMKDRHSSGWFVVTRKSADTTLWRRPGLWQQQIVGGESGPNALKTIDHVEAPQFLSAIRFLANDAAIFECSATSIPESLNLEDPEIWTKLTIADAASKVRERHDGLDLTEYEYSQTLRCPPAVGRESIHKYHRALTAFLCDRLASRTSASFSSQVTEILERAIEAARNNDVDSYRGIVASLRKSTPEHHRLILTACQAPTANAAFWAFVVETVLKRDRPVRYGIGIHTKATSFAGAVRTDVLIASLIVIGKRESRELELRILDRQALASRQITRAQGSR